MKNKTTITIETWKQTVVHKGRPIAALCQLCKTETEIFTPEKAAYLAQTTVREIYRLIENGAFHFIETTDGALFICGNSLQEKSEQSVIRLESSLAAGHKT